MIKNNLRIAFRNLKKNRIYTAIHIFGLYAGISFAFLITAFVWQELQVNKNLKNAENQYILTSQWKEAKMSPDFTTLAPIAERLKSEYPHLVADYYRWDGIVSIISTEDKIFRESIQLGDENLLSMFNFELLHGNASSAFEKPFSVVIKADRAIKYFGKTDVVGEILSIQNFSGESRQFTVSGVLKRISENSVMQINGSDDNGFFIGSNSATWFDRGDFQNWEVPIYPSYVLLQPGVEAKDLELPLKTIIRNHVSDEFQANLEIVPIRLTDYYFEKNEGAINKMLYTMSSIGLFIVFMAMINFINIAVSQSGSRMREIGIRKVLGGVRRQLIIQFLSESIILTAIATVLAVATYPVLQPWFGELIGKELIGFLDLPKWFLLIPVVLVATIGILAGLYPAFVLSSFNSIDALKGKWKRDHKGDVLRRVLVGFQFATALVVLVSTLIVAQQVNHFFEKGLGYEKEYVLTAQLPRDWSPEGVAKMKTVRDVFKEIPSVKNVSLSYEIPNGNNGFQIPAYRAGENSDRSIAAQGLVCDAFYLETYQIPLLAGSFFNGHDTSFNHVVINEKAIETYGFTNPDGAIGQQLNIAGSEYPLTITGVVANFHFESMQEAIKPQLFFSVDARPNYRYLSFKLKPGSINESITEIGEKWGSLMPGSAFDFQFMDETLQNLYSEEIQFKKAANTATILALIIALLGIFGMVALNIVQRAKEIGIRKVLGASVSNISFLFVKEFLVILAVSVVIAFPLVYWLMQDWLSNYAYRIDIGLSPFITGLALIGGLTAILIIFQTLKTVYQNPTHALRKE